MKNNQKLNQIKYLKGDATAPVRTGFDIIVHICNNIGCWGSGFVLALSKRWPQPEELYRNMSSRSMTYSKHTPLGSIAHCVVDKNLIVVNMIAQEGIRSQKKGPPIRYEALAECLAKVCELAKPLRATVHMPRIGCGLAGGTWDKVQPIVERNLTEKGIPVFVYDFF